MWIDCSGDIGSSITWTSFAFKSNDSSLEKNTHIIHRSSNKVNVVGNTIVEKAFFGGLYKAVWWAKNQDLRNILYSPGITFVILPATTTKA